MTKEQLLEHIRSFGFENLDRYLRASIERLHYCYNILARHLTDVSDGTVLDIGSADGVFLPALDNLQRFNTYHTVELEDRKAGKLILKGNDSSISAVVHALNIEEDTVPLPDSSVDLVIFSEVLEHLMYDPMRAMLEINRLLKPSGWLLLSTPNTNSAEAFRRMLKGTNPGMSTAFWPRQKSQQRHSREYSISEIEILLTSSGFEVHAKETFPEPTRRMSAIISSLRFLMGVRMRKEELGEHVCLLARKTRDCNTETLSVAERYPDPIYCTKRFTC